MRNHNQTRGGRPPAALTLKDPLKLSAPKSRYVPRCFFRNNPGRLVQKHLLLPTLPKTGFAERALLRHICKCTRERLRWTGRHGCAECMLKQAFFEVSHVLLSLDIKDWSREFLRFRYHHRKAARRAQCPHVTSCCGRFATHHFVEVDTADDAPLL